MQNTRAYLVDESTGRRENKEIKKREGLKLLQKGKQEAATKAFQQAISITQEMIRKAANVATEMGVECIIAPFEGIVVF